MLQRKQLIEQHKRLNWQYDIYGLLYSGHTVFDTNSLAPDGFRVASQSDFINLGIAIGPLSVFKIKSPRMMPGVGVINPTTMHPRWNYNSDTIGTDILNYSAIPNGRRLGLSFGDMGQLSTLHTSTASGSQMICIEFNNNNLSINYYTYGRTFGYGVRCCRDATLHEINLPDGTILPEITRDIEGNIYELVFINGIVWFRQNLKVTRFRNGVPIPLITTTWSGILTPAYCHYANNPANSFLTHLP
jgi:uncharacterized protein (TIGR02145 family)